jgi:hypothetical protein
VVAPVLSSVMTIETPIIVSLLEASETVPLRVNFCCENPKKEHIKKTDKKTLES